IGGRLLEGPTMVGRTSDWRGELGRWLKPFLDRLGHKARRQMCPLYVSGLIGPGDRKSVQPMASVETELLVQADKLVGGSDAVLVIDATAIPKKGTHSVGVAAQYASALGKNKVLGCDICTRPANTNAVRPTKAASTPGWVLVTMATLERASGL